MTDPNPPAPRSKQPVADHVESLNVHRRNRESEPPSPSRRIATQDLETIVRRAAELQHKDGEPGSQMLSEQEVLEIGRQVGLDPAHVRRAMAEVRADSLAPKPPPQARLMTLIAGSSGVETRRVIEGDPARIQKQLELLLRDQEKLTAVRQRPMRSLWEPSGGLFAKLERTLNFTGKKYALASASQVDVAVAEIEPGWAVVTLGAELENERNEILGTAGGILGSAVVASAAILFAILSSSGIANANAFLWSAALALLVGLTGAAVAVPWIRSALRKRCARIELLLESLLDQVDQR